MRNQCALYLKARLTGSRSSTSSWESCARSEMGQYLFAYQMVERKASPAESSLVLQNREGMHNQTRQPTCTAAQRTQLRSTLGHYMELLKTTLVVLTLLAALSSAVLLWLIRHPKTPRTLDFLVGIQL